DALDDHGSVCSRVDSVGAIPSVRNDGGEGHPLEDCVHLVGDLFETSADHGQGQRINVAAAHRATSTMIEPLSWTVDRVPGGRIMVVSICSITRGPSSD